MKIIETTKRSIASIKLRWQKQAALYAARELTAWIREQIKHIDPSITHDPFGTTVDGGTPSIVLNLAKKLDVLRDVVGVQPIDRPIGPAYFMELQHLAGESDTSTQSLKLAVVVKPIEAYSYMLPNIIKRGKVYAVTTEYIEAFSKCIVEQVISKVTSISTKLPDFNGNVEVLGVHINGIRNDIGRQTRRGVGNVVVLSSDVAQKLYLGSKAENSLLPKFEDVDISQPLTVISTTDNHPVTWMVCSSLPPETIIVGYKGLDCDTALVFAPYQLFRVSGVFNDEYMTSLTRFGLTELTPNQPTPYYQMFKWKVTE